MSKAKKAKDRIEIPMSIDGLPSVEVDAHRTVTFHLGHETFWVKMSPGYGLTVRSAYGGLLVEPTAANEIRVSTEVSKGK